MRYLISGGAGFVGSHLTEALVEQGHDVAVVDNLSNGNHANIASVQDKIHFIKGQVEYLNISGPLMFPERLDGIFHLATHPRSFSLQDPMRDIETNCKGMIAVLELARKHDAKVVFTSNSGIYGSMTGDQPITEKSGDNPTTPYDANKLVSEHYCRIYSRIHGVRSCIVRFATVYGPRQVVNEKLNWRPLVSTFVKNILNGEAVTVNGDGNQTRDLLYVKDAVQGVIKAMQGHVDNADVHLISTNSETSVNEVLRMIERMTGVQPEIQNTPALAGDIRRMRYDYAKAKAAFGYEPEYSLMEGLAQMLPVRQKA